MTTTTTTNQVDQREATEGNGAPITIGMHVFELDGDDGIVTEIRPDMVIYRDQHGREQSAEWGGLLVKAERPTEGEERNTTTTPKPTRHEVALGDRIFITSVVSFGRLIGFDRRYFLAEYETESGGISVEALPWASRQAFMDREQTVEAVPVDWITGWVAENPAKDEDVDSLHPATLRRRAEEQAAYEQKFQSLVDERKGLLAEYSKLKDAGDDAGAARAKQAIDAADERLRVLANTPAASSRSDDQQADELADLLDELTADAHQLNARLFLAERLAGEAGEAAEHDFDAVSKLLDQVSDQLGRYRLHRLQRLTLTRTLDGDDHTDGADAELPGD